MPFEIGFSEFGVAGSFWSWIANTQPNGGITYLVPRMPTLVTKFKAHPLCPVHELLAETP